MVVAELRRTVHLLQTIEPQREGLIFPGGVQDEGSPLLERRGSQWGRAEHLAGRVPGRDLLDRPLPDRGPLFGHQSLIFGPRPNLAGLPQPALVPTVQKRFEYVRRDPMRHGHLRTSVDCGRK